MFLHEDGTRETITAAELHARASAYASALDASGIGAGDLVVLVLQHSPVLLSAFWGALYRGAIPSILPYLTEKLDPETYGVRVRLLVEHSGARAVITFPGFRDRLRLLLAGLDCRVVGSDEVTPAPPGVSVVRPAPADSVAFLQHSSGTTGLQKGVALSHRAVLDQVDAYGAAIEIRPGDVVVSWLPLYHDMGLIAGFVMPIVNGVRLVLMSPFHWVRSPAVLLRAVHEHRGTLCWLPNFAYNHCARSIRRRDLEGLDLSCWRAAINCSEPVRHQSHRLFLDRFGPVGFREEALASCYAMAESTFAVTQSVLGRPPHVDWVDRSALRERRLALPTSSRGPDSLALVSCGAPIPGSEVAVVDAAGERQPDRREGEIVLRSGSMLSGYHRRPDATAEAIRDGWYHTGDMGYLADGELYVSGRMKDVIIVGGKNVHPHDLEALAEDVPGVHSGRVAAFGLDDEALGTEAVVMVCEVEAGAAPATREQVAAELRRRVVQETELTLKDVRVVDRRWIVKTSSGKVARADNRAKYLKEFGPTVAAR